MSEPSSSEKSGVVVSAAIEGDAELQAIRAVLGALVPLKGEGRNRVLDYVLKRLGVTAEPQSPSSASPSFTVDAFTKPPTPESRGQASDIRTLKKEKAPRSANEMAALVAYYLAEVAPEPYRKQNIDVDDVKTYFKQAPYPLPSSPVMTLVNAKNAGYLESAGTGQYRLNPVGYNLVVHALPAGTSGKQGSPKNTRKKKKKKKRALRKGN